jgi:hypothetical protein
MTIDQHGLRWKDEVRYGAALNYLSFDVETDGKRDTSISFTRLDIYQPGGIDNPIVTTTSVIGGPGGNQQYSYFLDASDTSKFALGMGYRASWSYMQSVFSGDLPVVRDVYFDVVRTPISHFCPLRIDDVLNAYAPLEKALKDSLAATDLVNTDVNLRYIVPAWQDVLQYVDSMGWRPALMSGPEQLYQMTLYRALQKVCEGLTRAKDDVWDRKAGAAKAEYEYARAHTVLTYNPGDSKGAQAQAGAMTAELLIGNSLRGGINNSSRGRI